MTIIRASQGWVRLGLGELWRHRELLYFLTWRDVAARYRQTLVGTTWAILQPLLAAVVFTVFFGNLAKVATGGVPYAVFTYSGLLPWTLFANGMLRSGTSLVNDAALIRKVYFPRLLTPTASVVGCVVDVCPALLVLLLMMLLYRTPLSVCCLFLPLPLAQSVVAALGAGFWLSALDVRFRDVHLLLPLLSQLLLFASPVVYSSAALREPLRSFYALNPMAGAIEGFRWALLGTPAPAPGFFVTSAVAGVVLMLSGALFFRRMERDFADTI